MIYFSGATVDRCTPGSLQIYETLDFMSQYLVSYNRYFLRIIACRPNSDRTISSWTNRAGTLLCFPRAMVIKEEEEEEKRGLGEVQEWRLRTCGARINA